MSRRFWMGLLLLAPAALVAQRGHGQARSKPPRHLVIGQIEDAHPAWKKAKVVFFSMSRLVGIEDEDQTSGRISSKHGILAHLQAGREYRVVARLDREDRETLWTKITKLPPGAIDFGLRPLRFAPARPRIHIQGRESWEGVSRIEFRLLDALGRSRPLAECLDEDRRLPSLPGAWCWIVMREASGRRLHLFPIALKKKDVPETITLTVPPPIQMRMQILHADTGRPIQGARLFEEFRRSEDIRKGNLESDAEGNLWFWMARPTDAMGRLDASRPVLFRILAKGHQLTVAGWNTSHLGAHGAIPTPREDGGLDLEVRMNPCKKLRGKLLHFPDSVLKQIRLFVRMQTMMPGQDENRLWTGLPWYEVAIQKDGSYALPRLSEGEGHVQRAFYFPDALLGSWPKLLASGRPLGRSERILPLPAVRITKGTGDYRLSGLDNRELQLLDLRVKLSDGKRGTDLPIRILYPENEIPTRGPSRLLGKFDGKGRFRRLIYGHVPAAYIQGPRGYALMEHRELFQEDKSEPDNPLVIRLTAMPTIRGSVSHVDGSPASASRVQLLSYKIPPTRLMGGPFAPYLKSLTSFALNTEVRADHQGRFEIPYLPFPQRKFRLFAIWRDVNGNSLRQITRILEMGDEKPVDLVFSR